MVELDPKKIRKDFPILKMKVNGFPLVYLDSAATSQKPVKVINAIKSFYDINANPRRSIHYLAEKAGEAYENARKRVADFVNADPSEIVFTRNSTESLNLVANSLQIRKGERVATTYMEHHSNILPWFNLKNKGVEVDVVDVDNDMELDMGYYEALPQNLRLVTVTQESNVSGTINDVRRISRLAHDGGALSLVDAAQSIPHMKIDVKDIGCDFMCFSGHKMLGPMGIGVLYIKKEVADKMRPFLLGGEMIKSVKLDKVEYSDTPAKFEAGTPNVEGAYGLAAAIDYLDSIGLNKIQDYEKKLVDHIYNCAKELKNLEVYSGKSKEFGGIFSFNVKGLHSHDVAYLLDRKGIAIRSGFHCAQPFIEDKLHANGAARASIYLYNTYEEIDKLFKTLKTLKF